MNFKKIVALLLSILTLTASIYLGGLHTMINTIAASADGLLFTEISSKENQFWQIIPADNSNNPNYTIRNIYTNQYLIVDENGLSAQKTSERLAATVFSLFLENNAYVFSADGQYISSESNAAVLSNTEYEFVLLGFATKSKTELQGYGTFLIVDKNNKALTDSGEAYYTVSKNADVISSAPTQKWQIDTAGIIDGKMRYTFYNIEINSYLSSTNGEVAVSGLVSDDVLWSVESITYKDIPQDCKMPDMYKYYYLIKDINGNVLYFDIKTESFKASANIGIGPSSIFTFSDGKEFLTGNVMNISNIGGSMAESDVWTEINRRYLQAVTDGYELSLTVQEENKQANQKWVFDYVTSVERSGCWYKNHYYTIKSVEFDLYLTVKNGSLVLAEKEEGNEYQLWSAFDMRWGWTITGKAEDRIGDEFSGRFSIKNKGSSDCLVVGGNRIQLQYCPDDVYVLGGQGQVWLFNGNKFDMGHDVGNEDTSKLKQSVEITLLGYATGQYLTSDGPDVPIEGSIKQLYISNDGNDSNDGLTEKTAIKTIDKALELINEKTIAKRGHISFRRGDTFVGTFNIDHILGRTGKLIYFDSYGDEKLPRPIIKSTNENPALIIKDSYCISVSDIDFISEKASESVVAVANTLNSQFNNINIYGNTGVKGNGINFKNSGSISDNTRQNIVLDNIYICGVNKGIAFENSGGMTLKNSTIQQTASSGIDIYDSQNIGLDNVLLENTSTDGPSAIYVTGSNIIIDNTTIENVEKGNGIYFNAVDNKTNAVEVKSSYFVGIKDNAIQVNACDKLLVNDVPIVAVDTLVIDNVLFYKNSGYDIEYTNTKNDSSNLVSHIGNSTFVESGNGYYSNYPNEITGVILNDNSFITETDYGKLRSEFRNQLKAALAIKKGINSDSVWAGFQSVLAEAVIVYNQPYVTKHTNDTMLEKINVALSSLVTEDKTTESTTESVTEEIKISIEESVLEMLNLLAKEDDETIALKVSEDFVLSTEMQKIVRDANKKLKITFVDENEEMLYQWMFNEMPCEYDIILTVNDTPDVGQKAKEGQTVSIKHQGVLPKNTQLIIKNTVFQERMNLELKLYDAENGNIANVDEGLCSKTVPISNDCAYLQLTIGMGGDYVIEKAVQTNVVEPVSEEGFPWHIVIISIVSAVVLAALAVVVIILIKRKSRKGEKI